MKLRGKIGDKSRDPFLKDGSASFYTDVDSLSPLLPTHISQLLPENNEKDYQQTFVAIGPILIDSLAAGEDITQAAIKAHVSPTTAIKLLATPDFQKYVETYLAIGDLTDRDARVRLSKTILASMIANGVISRRKDPLDILDYIRREHEPRKGGTNVMVQVNNTSVPRPYTIKEVEHGS